MDFPQQTESEARQSEFYKVNRFSRNSTIYGVTVGIILVTKLFIEYSFSFFSIVLTISGFSIINNYLIGEVTRKILRTGKYYNSTPRRRFFIGTLLSMLLFMVSSSFQKSIPFSSFFNYYAIAVLKSIEIFSLAAAIRAFGYIFRFPSDNLLRRGILGIVQRINIFIRDVDMFYIWMPYIDPDGTHKFATLLYCIGKLGGLIYLVYLTTNENMFIVWKLFRANKELLFVNAPDRSENTTNEDNKTCSSSGDADDSEEYDCDICGKIMKEPVVFPCGHICCYKCAYNWTKKHKSCLTCRSEVKAPYYIDLSDGILPLSLIIFPF